MAYMETPAKITFTDFSKFNVPRPTDLDDTPAVLISRTAYAAIINSLNDDQRAELFCRPDFIAFAATVTN